MTPEELKAIEERCNKATPGPWTVDEHWDTYIWGPNKEMIAQKIVDIRGVGERLPIKENMEFVAHSREDVPALLAYIEELEYEVNGFRTYYHKEYREE